MSSALSSKNFYNGLHQMPLQNLRLRSSSGWLATYGAAAEALIITSSVISRSNMRTSCKSASRLHGSPETAAARSTATTSNEQRRLSKTGTAIVDGEDGRQLDTNNLPNSIFPSQIRPKAVGLIPHSIDGRSATSNASDSAVRPGYTAVSETVSSPPAPVRRHLPLQGTFMRRARRPARGLRPLNGLGSGGGRGGSTTEAAAPRDCSGGSVKISVQAGCGHCTAVPREFGVTALPREDGQNPQTMADTAAARPRARAEEHESIGSRRDGGSAAVTAAVTAGAHNNDVEDGSSCEDAAGGGGGGCHSGTMARTYGSSNNKHSRGGGGGISAGGSGGVSYFSLRDSVGGEASDVGQIRRTHNPIKSSPSQLASSGTSNMSNRNIYSSTCSRSVSRSSTSGSSINTSNSRMPAEGSSSSNSSGSSMNSSASGSGGSVSQDPKAQVQGELPDDVGESARQVAVAVAAGATSSSSIGSSSSSVPAEQSESGQRRAFHRNPAAAAAAAAATNTGGAVATAKRNSQDVSRITKGGNRMPRTPAAAGSSSAAAEMPLDSGRSRAFTATAGAGDAAASSTSTSSSSSSAPGSKGPYLRTTRSRLHTGSLLSRGANRTGQQEQVNPWSVRCVPIDMEATYPDLASFAAAVRSQAASEWHPLVISAALNHATKMMEALDRRMMPPQLQGGTVSDRRNFDRADEEASSPRSQDNVPPSPLPPPSPSLPPAPAAAPGSNSRGPSHPDEKILREILDILYDAYLPYVRTIINSRYVINALWVCAKTGYWGPPGHRLVPALFDRLRQNNYSLLCRSDGQAHGILWWALSQCDAQLQQQQQQQQQQPQQQKSGAQMVAAATALRGDDPGPDGVAKGQVAVADGSSAPSEARPPAAVSAEAGAGSSLVSGGMDLLRLSASVIKKRELLNVGFKPQEFSNIIIAAARLQYADDPRLIDHLLTHMVKHPGPFKPQAISNTIYGLGELYGNKQELYGSTAGMEVVDEDEDGSNNVDLEQKQGDQQEGEEDGTPREGQELAAEARETEAAEAENIPHINNTSGFGGGGFGAEDEKDSKLGTEGSRVAAAAATAAAAREEAGASGGLPVSLAGHIRSLVGLALKLGLHSFSPQELSNMIYGLARLGLRMNGGAAAGNTPPPPSAATAPDSDGDSDGRSGSGDGAAGLAGPAGDGRTSPSPSRPPVLPPPTLGSPAASSASRSQSQLRSTSNEHSPQSPDVLNPNGSFPLPEDPDTAARHFVVRLDKHVRQRLQPTCTRSGLRPFDPQSLSNITWALAVIGYADQSYFVIAVHAALYGGCMDDACPQEWVIFLWTLASRTHRPPLDLLHLLHSRLYGGPPWTAEDQQKAWPILLWSLSMLDLYDEDVVSWISDSVSPSNIAELDAQRLATCLFSLAVMPEGVLNRHAALVDKLVAAANRIETQEYGSIGCIQLWQFHLELLATTNSQQLPSTAYGSAAATSTAQSCPPRDRNCPTRRRRMTSSDATGPAASIHTHTPTATTSAATAITTSRPQAQSPLAVRRHLSPALVAAARDALLRRNARISSANASSLQLSVYSHLRMIQLNQINQLQAHTAAAAAEQGHQLQQPSQQQPEVKLHQRQRQRQQHDEVEREQQLQQYQHQHRQHQHQGPKARKRSRSMPDLTSVVDVFSATNAAAAAAAAAANTTSSTVIGSSFATTSHGALLDSSGESGDESADAAAQAATAARTTFGRWRRARVEESCINSCSATAAVRILRVEQEWLVEALALRVDLCVWLSNGRQVVVEVDGPSHYFANLLRTQRPKTALRNRQLSRVFGAENVQCVPYWDWEVTAGVEARTAYLSRLLGLLGPE